MHHHKWSLTEIENLLPWEREIYTSLLAAYLKEEKDKREQQS